MAVYYLCEDYEAPSGGIRVIYRHVDLLNKNGVEAYVVHERQGFRCNWFENETPVLGWSQERARQGGSASSRAAARLKRRLSPSVPENRFLATTAPVFALERDDMIVIPELFGPRLAEIAPGTRKLIFNQGPSLSFRGYPADPRGVAFSYRHPEIAGVLVISEYVREQIEYAFPGVETHRVRLSVNPELFSAGSDKLRRIAYMPRRGGPDGEYVIAVLAARGVLDGFEIVPIDGLDERGVASILRKTLVFLGLGYQEGLGLPSAEAMACGATVVGYDGFGGREFLTAELAFPVPAADLRAFSRTLEQVLHRLEEAPCEMEERAQRASRFIHTTYSPEREEAELVAVWRGLLN